MTPNIYKKMVYSYLQPMWHDITKPSTEPLTAVEILDKRFEGAFTVETRPVTVALNGIQQETGDFAIVRSASKADPDEVVFGYCTDRYHPLQPRDVAQCFDTNVCEPAETMAFLGKGEDMFISWKMPSYEVRVGDEVDMYGIVRTGFDTLKGTRLFIANVRPVCWNTISMAEGWAKAHTDKKANKGIIWKGKGVNKNLLRDLGYWMEHVQTKALVEANLLQSFFGKLASVPIKNEEQAVTILNTAYPDAEDISAYFPRQLRDAKAEAIADFNEGQAETRNGIKYLFDGAGTAITPDFWGMLNSTSEYFCHYQPSKKHIAESVMFGPRQQKIMSMVETLNKLSK